MYYMRSTLRQMTRPLGSLRGEPAPTLMILLEYRRGWCPRRNVFTQCSKQASGLELIRLHFPTSTSSGVVDDEGSEGSDVERLLCRARGLRLTEGGRRASSMDHLIAISSSVHLHLAALSGNSLCSSSSGTAAHHPATIPQLDMRRIAQGESSSLIPDEILLKFVANPPRHALDRLPPLLVRARPGDPSSIRRSSRSGCRCPRTKK